MSSLIFYITPELGLIATDTIASSHNRETPSIYSTKAIALPHLRLLICGTGCAGFINHWVFTVNSEAVTRDIQHLNTFVTQSLQKSWVDMTSKFNVPIGSTTIYHFGFSSSDDILHAYAYRSANNFESENLTYGTGIKPPVSSDVEFSLPEDLRLIMDKQIEQENKKPKNERLLIGGEIILYIIKPDCFHIVTHDRFDDYEENLKIMFDENKKNREQSHSH